MKQTLGIGHPLVPNQGGLIIQSEPLGLLSRIPTGAAQIIYLDPPLLNGPLSGNDGRELLDKYRIMIEELLKQAKRALSSSGNLFVRFPTRHDYIDMGAALGQLFGHQKPHLITFLRLCPPGLSKPGPRSDRETMFLVQMSSMAVYNSKKLPVELRGATHRDRKGIFRWETLDRPAVSSFIPIHDFHGTTLPPGRGWKFTLEKMEELFAEGRIAQTSSGRWALKRYADEVPLVEASLDWDDIPVSAPWSERVSVKVTQLSAQEPLALMERIIEIGSHEGDLVVMLPANEYGSGVVACHRLGRRWLTTFQTPGGLDNIRNRLISEGAVLGPDFASLEANQFVSFNEYPVDGPPPSPRRRPDGSGISGAGCVATGSGGHVRFGV